ncbi:hypothetical protein GE09DRAFT_1056628 [Coniochaeta sp. 2T2.1]|nr:hypothetical protein GE09DRAFT_1056628 [Coniochaeta sp. 2T2.1]
MYRSGAVGQSLTRIHQLSDRPYVERVTDKGDFAYAWENIILPPLLEILDEYEEMPFSIDVHNFPNLSADPVLRVIYITLPARTPLSLQKLLVNQLQRNLPSRFFNTTSLRIRLWDAGRKKKQPASARPPRNPTFQGIATPGISVGREGSKGVATLGGFVKIGGDLYGMTSRRAIGSVMQGGGLGVVHPAESDRKANQSNGLPSRQRMLGDILCGALTYDNRPSLTSDTVLKESDQDQPRHYELVSLGAIGGPVMMQGNMEVYAVARTSGHSLGVTSDVPGLQRIDGHYRREWTSVEAWVTSGFGVSGESGAWLTRKPDNALIGPVWGGDQNYGAMADLVRFTYVMPIMDVFGVIEERVGFDVSLPTYRGQQSVLGAGEHSEPGFEASMDRPTRPRSAGTGAERYVIRVPGRRRLPQPFHAFLPARFSRR